MINFVLTSRFKFVFYKTFILFQNIFVSFSSIFAVLLLTNSISKPDYSFFIFYFSIFSIGALFYDQFDILIPKFYSKNIFNILYKILVVKSFIFIISSFIIYFFVPHIEIRLFLLISSFFFLDQLYKTLNTSFLTIFGLGNITQLEFFLQGFYLSLLIYFKLNNQLSVFLYLTLNIVSLLFLILYVVWNLRNCIRNTERKLILVDFRVLINYLIPLQLVSIQSVFKNHILKIVIYQYSGPIALFNFDILTRIYSKIYEVYTSLLKKITPIYIKNPDNFSPKFFKNVLSLNFIIFYLIVFILYELKAEVLSIFKVDYNLEFKFILFILSLELIVNVYGQLSNLVLKSSNNTKNLLYSSLSRLFFSIISIPIFIYFFNESGIYYSKVLSTFILVFSLTYFRRKILIIPYEILLLIITISLILILFYAL
jgi:O-antigen/teichoic acid export membrane protein